VSVELKVPESGESISEVEIAEWVHAEGDYVERDEVVVVLETDKASLELPAPVSGRLIEIVKKRGKTAKVGEVIGRMEEAEKPAEEKQKARAPGGADGRREEAATGESKGDARAPGSAPAGEQAKGKQEERVTPAARRALAEEGLEAGEVEPSGPGGRLLKEDVLRYARERRGKARETVPGAAPPSGDGREEETVPMTLMRRRIAERLVRAQHEAALLTTFNEIDMTAVKELREQYRESFEERYGTRLGFMSFFVKAVIDALKHFPQLNAEIRDQQIVYRNYYDIGIAVGGGKRLVVPVLRNADRMSFAQVEQAIRDFADRARENRLSPEDLQGGTFTISNGGVYGSLLSTPLINPPQSGVLGLHAIQDRPVVRDGEVVVRPMMYVALTYDHRIVDGREAVTFLKRIKEAIEDPSRILLEI
jgi:2-oxoglutarate dehydrogenase E2 component (dihydrolipoamide succinyltransferase)